MATYNDIAHLYDPLVVQHNEQQPQQQTTHPIQNNAATVNLFYDSSMLPVQPNYPSNVYPPQHPHFPFNACQQPWQIFPQQHHHNDTNNYCVRPTPTTETNIPAQPRAMSQPLFPPFVPDPAFRQTQQVWPQPTPEQAPPPPIWTNIPQTLQMDNARHHHEGEYFGIDAENSRQPPSNNYPSNDAPTNPSSTPATDAELKVWLCAFFTSARPNQNLLNFCNEKELSVAIYHQLRRRLIRNERLRELVNHRDEEECVNEAIAIVNEMIPAGPFVSAESFTETTDYFTPDGIREMAEKLDFAQRPRMTRCGNDVIVIHKKKNMGEREKSLTFQFASIVATNTPNMSKAEQKEVLKHAATIVMYDHGYEKVKGVNELKKKWWPRVIEYFKTGIGGAPLKNKSKGRKAYSDKIEAQYPSYIHKLYRKAEEKLGWQASFAAMARKINEISRTSEWDEYPDLQLTAAHLRRHFRRSQGKLKSPMEKPYKTDDQNRETLEWVQNTKALKQEYGRDFHVCFLDEKWFYTTSRRRKIKVLPAHELEDPSVVPSYTRTCISRRHPTKVRIADNARVVDCCMKIHDLTHCILFCRW